MGIISTVRTEFIVQLDTVETSAAAGLDTFGIVISLTRGVGWTDVEIKTNILNITMQHGYFIKWPSDLSNAGPHCIYFILGYICVFKKKEAPQAHIPLLGQEFYHLVGQKDPVK